MSKVIAKRKFDGNGYRDMTAEEIAEREADARLSVIYKRNRPLTQEEVSCLLISQQINTLTVDDNTSLRMKEFYPEWAPDTNYSVGFKVQHKGKLYSVLQAHTAQTGWEPENAASLWVEINETHDGSIDDPIPYSGNMALENGKYYIQDNVIYLCNRDTVNPVYNPLAELVGIYVEEV
jgi:hypothetical protein